MSTIQSNSLIKEKQPWNNTFIVVLTKNLLKGTSNLWLCAERFLPISSVLVLVLRISVTLKNIGFKPTVAAYLWIKVRTTDWRVFKLLFCTLKSFSRYLLPLNWGNRHLYFYLCWQKLHETTLSAVLTPLITSFFKLLKALNSVFIKFLGHMWFGLWLKMFSAVNNI